MPIGSRLRLTAIAISAHDAPAPNGTGGPKTARPSQDATRAGFGLVVSGAISVCGSAPLPSGRAGDAGTLVQVRETR